MSDEVAVIATHDIGVRVETKEHGWGTVVKYESGVPHYDLRYGVMLDTTPFSYNPAFYFPHELKEPEDEPFTCQACGRPEENCSRDPCATVIREREE